MSVDDEVDVVMANARPPDSPEGVLARARIENALFGTPSTIARFHVLERLGKGGMGIVYAAYDPELDRGVALKMIHVPANARALALAEGKALAKLSHPNVVPVFDVGVLEDQVYIVMELVRGKVLADWTREQSVRAIVDAYRQAGAALAAAHDAGLVHRDFKPANAIVGNDGRLRVVDFGLACETETRANAAGTPRYMAPELRAGEITPAADQYSFCVALGDALGAQAPRWVADVVARGRAPDPADRFSSMHDLLRALGRDPARVRRRRIGLGAIAAALGIAFFVGHSRARAAESCAGGAAELAAAWPERDRAQQLARIASAGTYGFELATTVRQSLQVHAKHWVAGHRDACVAHRRGESSAALLDRRMVCLDRARAALTAVADIVAYAEAGTLSEVAHAVSALPEPQACAELAVLNDVDPPPRAAAAEVARLRRDIDRARVLVAAGRTTAARDLARQAATALAAIPYGPLLAEAQLVEGHAMLRTDQPGASAAFDRALATALAHRRDAIAIEAWARRAWIIGTQGEPARALGALDVMEALATRTPDATFARALLYNNAGSIELVRERRAEARTLFERALRDAARVHGPGAVELAAIHRNLALVTVDEAARDRELALYRDTLARLLGTNHPDVLLMQYMRATTSLAQPAEAMAVLATTCEEMKRHDSLETTMAPCLVELATLRDELGDHASAIATLEQASRYPHPDQPELDGLLALWHGDPTRAIALLEAALADAPATETSPFYVRFARANLELVYGRALRTVAGRGREARAAFERGFALLGSVTFQAVAVQRRLAALNAERAAMSGSP